MRDMLFEVITLTRKAKTEHVSQKKSEKMFCRHYYMKTIEKLKKNLQYQPRSLSGSNFKPFASRSVYLKASWRRKTNKNDFENPKCSLNAIKISNSDVKSKHKEKKFLHRFIVGVKKLINAKPECQSRQGNALFLLTPEDRIYYEQLKSKQTVTGHLLVGWLTW